jgi:hypothetical protein
MVPEYDWNESNCQTYVRAMLQLIKDGKEEEARKRFTARS